MSLPSSRTYGAWLALVRVLTGAAWLLHALPKFKHGDTFVPPNGFFATYLQDGIVKSAGPYHDFLVNVVQPNAIVFADLVRVGELLVGVSLVLGLFARLGGFFGILLPLNYMAARGALVTVMGWSSGDAALALLSAISFVLPTGRVAGIDALMARRAARRTTVVPEVVPEPPLDRPSAPP